MALEADTFTTSTTLRRAQPPGDADHAGRQRHPPRLQRGQPARARRRESARRDAGRRAGWTPFVTDIDYDAKGQRERIDYGNGVSTTYDYDPLTFRLIRLHTLREAASALQDLSYTYDPVGNITHIQRRRAADDLLPQQARRAERRLHLRRDLPADRSHRPRAPRPDRRPAQRADRARCVQRASTPAWTHPGDGNAMGRTSSATSTTPSATSSRCSTRQRPGASRLDARLRLRRSQPDRSRRGKVSNRLSTTQVGDGQIEPYTYDAHGNMTAMPHLPLMQWNYRDQLAGDAASRWSTSGTPETTYYVYDAGGQRVRKVTERQAAAGRARRRARTSASTSAASRSTASTTATAARSTLERETLHVMDDKQRIALVETRTHGDDGSAAQLIRYQLGNHLGSASLELDEAGADHLLRGVLPLRQHVVSGGGRSASRRRRSAIGTRGRSGMRRPGWPTTARGFTRPGWGGGRAAIQSGLKGEPTSIVTQTATPFDIWTQADGRPSIQMTTC